MTVEFNNHPVCFHIAVMIVQECKKVPSITLICQTQISLSYQLDFSQQDVGRDLLSILGLFVEVICCMFD